MSGDPKTPIQQLQELAAAGVVPMPVFEAFRELLEDADIAADFLQSQLDDPSDSWTLYLIRNSVTRAGGDV